MANRHEIVKVCPSPMCGHPPHPGVLCEWARCVAADCENQSAPDRSLARAELPVCLDHESDLAAGYPLVVDQQRVAEAMRRS